MLNPYALFLTCYTRPYATEVLSFAGMYF